MSEYIEIMELVAPDGERLSLSHSCSAFGAYGEDAQRYTFLRHDIGEDHVYGLLDFYWIAEGVMHSVYGHICSVREWETP